ncbi:MAG: carbonic anhydrase family protein [Xenococcus sp. (in: cyanobacteria)]
MSLPKVSKSAIKESTRSMTTQLEKSSDCEVIIPEWSYCDPGTNEDNWGNFGSQCVNGRMQSPINIPEATDKGTTTLTLRYGCPDLQVKNNGRKIEVECCEHCNQLTVNEREYVLKEFHFHTPSEHTINGQRYNAECHLVHYEIGGSEDDPKLVLAILLKTDSNYDDDDDDDDDDDGSNGNSFLELITSNLPELGGCSLVNNDTVNIREFFPKRLDFYEYGGSLTTPKCGEGIRWFVFKQAVFALPEQIEALRSLFACDNVRSIQPLNGRTIKCLDGENVIFEDDDKYDDRDDD